MTFRRLAPIVILTALAACSSSDANDTASANDTTATTATTEAATTTNPPASETTAPTTEPTATEPTTTEAAPTTTAAAPTTTAVPEPAPWAPIGAGEYEVGVATVTVDDPDGERPLTVDVWFPLDGTADAAALPAQRYTLIPDVYFESPGAVAATVDQLAGDGPFPLIVYSHGSSGLRFIHSSYTEALASHGYVVVAADHTGNTAIDLLAGNVAEPGTIALARPNDVRRLVDAFTDPAHPAAGPFATSVDAELVAITGHSFGGFTALASVTGFGNDLGNVDADRRVDAIVLLAPAVGSTSFTDETLAGMTVPMMVLVGTDDITTPVDPNVTRLWDVSSNAPAYRVELVAAEHQTFTDLCAYQDQLPALSNVPEIVSATIDDYALEGCSPGDMDDDRAVELTNTYVLQFLDQVLGDGPPIDPSAVATPVDVIFDAR
jgi:predicted dienelactone hydrolase